MFSVSSSHVSPLFLDSDACDICEMHEAVGETPVVLLQSANRAKFERSHLVRTCATTNVRSHELALNLLSSCSMLRKVAEAAAHN